MKYVVQLWNVHVICRVDGEVHPAGDNVSKRRPIPARLRLARPPHFGFLAKQFGILGRGWCWEGALARSDMSRRRYFLRQKTAKIRASAPIFADLRPRRPDTFGDEGIAGTRRCPASWTLCPPTSCQSTRSKTLLSKRLPKHTHSCQRRSQSRSCSGACPLHRYTTGASARLSLSCVTLHCSAAGVSAQTLCAQTLPCACVRRNPPMIVADDLSDV